MKIQFCGATTGVTGSCHLITTANHKILLDCGQFQGGKAQEELNYEPFPFDPAEIEYLVLSHAHIDHCGRIPLLVKRGFKGQIYCTDATADLLGIMLMDSGHIHEQEAEWQNRKNSRAGRPLVEPLYTELEAEESLKFVKPVLYNQLVELNDEVRICFNDAGHILGSGEIEIFVSEKEEGSSDVHATKIVFSGDLGVMDRPILRNPTIIKKADYVIMETTYGNRNHPDNAMDVNHLVDIICETAARGGNSVIPSFAVGRTQELIFELNRIYEDPTDPRQEQLSKIKVYVDSPMAAAATEVFKNNAQVFDEETKDYISKGENPLEFPNLKFTQSTEESQWLNIDKEPKVIISASGMCEAGRIRHHLKHNLWDARNSIIFVGYQAEGTLGRCLIEGEKEVTLFGESIQVNAKIHNLEGFSGHADMNGLLAWLKGFQKAPKQLFLVHGEPEVKLEFAKTVKEQIGFDAIPVNVNAEYELEEGGGVVTMKEAIADAVDEKRVNEARENLYNVRRRLEDILYNANLNVNNGTDPEKLARINNTIMELEKSVINLGSIISESDESENVELTDEQIAELRAAREENIQQNKKEKKSAKK
ncbi:MAG: MBL fold metallo-hydrolase [Clostridiales bacterium]|nr:MBL fold metallo-hydrolase [Clostridiales bacterium]